MRSLLVITRKKTKISNSFDNIEIRQGWIQGRGHGSYTFLWAHSKTQFGPFLNLLKESGEVGGGIGINPYRHIFGEILSDLLVV